MISVQLVRRGWQWASIARFAAEIAAECRRHHPDDVRLAVEKVDFEFTDELRRNGVALVDATGGAARGTPHQAAGGIAGDAHRHRPRPALGERVRGGAPRRDLRERGLGRVPSRPDRQRRRVRRRPSVPERSQHLPLFPRELRSPDAFGRAGVPRHGCDRLPRIRRRLLTYVRVRCRSRYACRSAICSRSPSSSSGTTRCSSPPGSRTRSSRSRPGPSPSSTGHSATTALPTGSASPASTPTSRSPCPAATTTCRVRSSRAWSCASRATSAIP